MNLLKKLKLGLFTLACLAPMAACERGVTARWAADREAVFNVDWNVQAAAARSPEQTAATPPLVFEGEGLDAYIVQGLAHNASLRTSFDRWRSSIERIAQVKALPDPRFSWTYFIREVETRTGPQDNKFSLSQKIPWFGKLRKQGDLAAIEADALWQRVEARRLAVIRQIKRAYYEYAYLAQAIHITEENLNLLLELEPIVQRRVQVGASLGDLIRLQVEIGKVENDLDGLKDLRSALSSRLDAALNLEPGTVYPWPEIPVPEQVDSPSSQPLLPLLADLNPELLELRFRIDAGQKRIELAKLQKFPDVTFGVDYIGTGEAVGPIKPPDSSLDPIAVSLSLNLPIWRGKYAAAEREARAARAADEQALQQKYRDLASDLEMSVYSRSDSGRQLVLYRNDLLPRAKEALELTEVAYESGRASILDVIDREREVLAFGISLWRSVANYHQNLADLEALCGGPLP